MDPDKENYEILQINNGYKCDLNHLINNIKNNNRVIFTKFGDGEYNCMIHTVGNNCDGDTYTNDLGDKLKEAFNELSYLSKDDDGIYIGKWHSDVQIMLRYYSSIFYDFLKEKESNLINIPFVDYHYCYNEHRHFGENKDLYNFVKTIQEINKYKLVVSNEENVKLSLIFKVNNYITIPPNSWYANNLYDKLYNAIDNQLNNYNDAIVILSAGLATKVLIKDLAIKYKNASFIDIGSGFDLLARKRMTRQWYDCKEHGYLDEYNYYKDLLPIDF